MANNFQKLETLLRNTLLYSNISNPVQVQDLVNIFLHDVTSDNYAAMKSQLDSAQAAYITDANDLRILVALSDGTVVYDGSKSNNTYQNMLSKLINENHNTRPEIMLCILNSSGSGQTTRHSSSLNKNLLYNALRLGSSVNENVGTYRVSID